MAKLTRKSYKRKKITFAAVLLAGIALVSTGFAAWVLSSQVAKKAEGNVTVGAVSKTNLELTVTPSTDANFSFEPLENDVSGRVRWDGTHSENLSVTFDLELTSTADVLKDVTVKMDQVDEIDAAVAAGYIVAPTCYNDVITLQASSFEKDTTSGYTWTTSYTVAFSWGDTFGNVNPSKYYDTVEAGIAVSDENVASTLEAFYDSLGAASGVEYTITFTAELN